MLLDLAPSYGISRVSNPAWGSATAVAIPTATNAPIQGAYNGRSSLFTADMIPMTSSQREAFAAFTQGLESTIGRIGEFRNGFISAWLLQLLSSQGHAWQEYYDQMLCDPVVESNLNLRATAVCSDDNHWIEGVAPDHRLFDLAREAKEFVEYNFSAMGMDLMDQPASVGFSGFNRLLYQVARVADVGYRVVEVTYKPPQDMGDRFPTLKGHGTQLINAIEVKEPFATALITDRRKRILGILDRTYWAGVQMPMFTYDMYGKPVGGVYWLGHPYYPSWTLKYIVHTWSPIDNDPLGNPLMRQIFASWWARQIVENQKLRFSEESVFPVVVGTTPENAVKICDAQGNEIDPVAVMSSILANGISRGDRVFTFPFGAQVKQLPPMAAAKDLVEIGATFEASIRAVALGSPLQTGVAQFQTQGSTQAQSNWTNVVLRGHQIWLQDAIRQYAYRIIALNYGGLVDPLDLPLIVPMLKLDNVRSRAEMLQTAQAAKLFADAGLMTGIEQANYFLEAIDAPLLTQFTSIQEIQRQIEEQKIKAQERNAERQATAAKEAAKAAPKQESKSNE